MNIWKFRPLPLVLVITACILFPFPFHHISLFNLLHRIAKFFIFIQLFAGYIPFSVSFFSRRKFSYTTNSWWPLPTLPSLLCRWLSGPQRWQFSFYALKSIRAWCGGFRVFDYIFSFIFSFHRCPTRYLVEHKFFHAILYIKTRFFKKKIIKHQTKPSISKTPHSFAPLWSFLCAIARLSNTTGT